MFARATAIEHNHVAGDHFRPVACLAILILPLAGLQAAFDIHTAGLAQMLVADLGKLVPGDDVEPLGFFTYIASAIFPLAAGCDAERRHRAAAGRVAHLWIFAKPPD